MGQVREWKGNEVMREVDRRLSPDFRRTKSYSYDHIEQRAARRFFWWSWWSWRKVGFVGRYCANCACEPTLFIDERDIADILASRCFDVFIGSPA